MRKQLSRLLRSIDWFRNGSLKSITLDDRRSKTQSLGSIDLGLNIKGRLDEDKDTKDRRKNTHLHTTGAHVYR